MRNVGYCLGLACILVALPNSVAHADRVYRLQGSNQWIYEGATQTPDGKWVVQQPQYLAGNGTTFTFVDDPDTKATFIRIKMITPTAGVVGQQLYDAQGNAYTMPTPAAGQTYYINTQHFTRNSFTETKRTLLEVLTIPARYQFGPNSGVTGPAGVLSWTKVSRPDSYFGSEKRLHLFAGLGSTGFGDESELTGIIGAGFGIQTEGKAIPLFALGVEKAETGKPYFWLGLGAGFPALF